MGPQQTGPERGHDIWDALASISLNLGRLFLAIRDRQQNPPQFQPAPAAPGQPFGQPPPQQPGQQPGPAGGPAQPPRFPA